MTVLLGLYAASLVAGDYSRGPNSEFDLSGLRSLVVIGLAATHFVLLAVAGLALRLSGRKSWGRAVHMACALSLPLVVLSIGGGGLLSQARSARESERRDRETEARNVAARAAEAAQAASIERALRANPSDTSALSRRAEQSARRNDFGNAIVDLRRVIALEPDNVQAHVELARALTATQKYDEAIAAYEAAMRLNPSLTATLAPAVRQCRELGQRQSPRSDSSTR
ncbi:MAG: tetratricopeptide repeat protein [Myxococcaceae bacterium]|nr:MAG: tetratricopeptide repeat protein [Myxococcaceae bacterium]